MDVDHRPLRDLIDVASVGQVRRVDSIAITLCSVERYANGARVVAGLVVEPDHPMMIAWRAADEAHHAAFRHGIAEGGSEHPAEKVEPCSDRFAVAPSYSGWPRWAAFDELGTP